MSTSAVSPMSLYPALKTDRRSHPMQLGASLPVADVGTGPTVLRDYTQAAEGLGYADLVAPDRVPAYITEKKHSLTEKKHRLANPNRPVKTVANVRTWISTQE